MTAILHSPRLRPLRKVTGVAVRATYRTPVPLLAGR
jgi:hypothetical protein